jgi:hypothetical protein
MIQQSIAQFTRNAQKATSIADDDKLPDRQRGMWSFLTWSFFLAQAVAAHEAFAKGHAGGDAGADADGSGSSNGDDAAQKGLPSTSMLGASGFDGDPAAAAQFAAAIAAGLVTPQMLAGFQADPALFQAFVDQLTGNASAAAGDITAAAGSAEELAAAATGEGDGGSQGGPIPGIDLPGGITLPIDIAIDLGLELGSDLGLGLHVGGLDDISLNLNVAPILGLNFGLDGDGLSLSALGIDFLSANGGGTLGSLLGGENGVLGGLPLGGAVEAISGVTGLAYNVLGGPLGHLASSPSHLLSGGQDLASNVAGGLAPVTAPVTSLLGDVLDYGSHSGLLASGGTILQSAGSILPLHDLFANGEHTDYGVELQSSQPLDPAHGGSLVASLSANVDTLDVAALADDALKSLLHGISSDYHG